MTYHHTDKRYADKIGFNNVLGETSQHFMETSNTKSWKSLIDFQDFVFEYQWFCGRISMLLLVMVIDRQKRLASNELLFMQSKVLLLAIP